ncbi:MAG TPA: GldG family protein [Burkholderiales bacterium]|jgi:ABC-type uncharacterized transport system involved in gliding motility auxiliary subunit|nr:GldG family protein [Burkholderiales bacterium]
MKMSRKLRLALLVQNSLFVVLLVGIVGVVLYLTKDIKTQWDLTQGKRNTLSEASADVLRQMRGAVSVTAFATRQDTEGDLRKTIQDFIAPYQRVKHDFSLSFVDPREEPKRAQEAGVRLNGELVVEYGGRRENLTNLSEQDLTNLLVRLMRSSERMVMYLDGHGEGKLDGRGNLDLGDFGNQLIAKGFKIGALNLAVAQDVPDNVSVLLIAGPRADLLPGEVNRIKRHLERGGNLLWLMDPDSLRGMGALAEYLGLELLDGVVLDPQAGAMGMPAAFALGSPAGGHPITERSPMITLFPYARRVAAHAQSKFRFTPLVEAAARGWLETGGLTNARFDANRDLRGPIVVAGALEREVGERKQRVVVAGSGRFLSNQYLGNVGNLDLGVNMINWLAGDDTLITIQPRVRADLNLQLPWLATVAISYGFLVILPLGFLMAGSLIWWRRRRA